METHCRPEEALSDGPQALLPSDFLRLVEQVRAIHGALRKGGVGAGLAF